MVSRPATSKQRRKARKERTSDAAWSLVKALADLNEAIPPSSWRALWQAHEEMDPYLFATIMKCNRLATDTLPLQPPRYPTDCNPDGAVHVLSSDDSEVENDESPRSSGRRAGTRLRPRRASQSRSSGRDGSFSATGRVLSSSEDSQEELTTDVLSEVDAPQPEDEEPCGHPPSGYIMCNHRYERLEIGGIYSVPVCGEHLSYFEVINATQIRWFYTPEECADAAKEKSFSDLRVPEHVHEDNCVVALETLFYDHKLHIDVKSSNDEAGLLLNAMENPRVQILFDSNHDQELACLWPLREMEEDIGICSVNAQSIVAGAPPYDAGTKLIYVVGEFHCDSLMIDLYTKSPYDFTPKVDLKTDRTNLVNMLLSNMRGKVEFPDLKNTCISRVPKDSVKEGTCQLCMTRKPLSFLTTSKHSTLLVGSLCEQRLSLAKRAQEATTRSALHAVKDDILAFLAKNG